jgi:hypothetical protein
LKTELKLINKHIYKVVINNVDHLDENKVIKSDILETATFELKVNDNY